MNSIKQQLKDRIENYCCALEDWYQASTKERKISAGRVVTGKHTGLWEFIDGLNLDPVLETYEQAARRSGKIETVPGDGLSELHYINGFA
jgi:hypothetical protein